MQSKGTNEARLQDYRDALREEFLTRKKRNPSYSVRAFAQSSGVGKSTLADVLANKRHLSRQNALRLAKHFDFSPDQLKVMLTEIRGLKDKTLKADYQPLEEDTFRLIADWYHYGILSLAKLKNNRGDADWIAKRLGITPLEARSALLRLQRLGYIAVENRKLVRKIKPLDTIPPISTQALRSHQKQVLELAQHSLENDPIEIRSHVSMTMAIDPARIPKAKLMIPEFRNRLSEFLEAGEPTEVYTVAIQLFPLSRKGKKQ